jgi:hypothetical protein
MSEENGDELPDLFTGVEEAKGDRSLELNLKPSDRPRGILSPTDRDYLCGLKDYSHNQTELNRQQSIRERIIEGLRDFDLLWLLLDEAEREKIIDSLETEEIDTAFSSMVSFMYLGLDRDTDHIEDIIEEGVYNAVNYDGSGRWSGGANEVSVNIDIDRHPDVSELYKRFKAGEGDQLTSAEIGALVQAGKLDAEDLQALENTTDRFPKVYSGAVLEQGDEP